MSDAETKGHAFWAPLTGGGPQAEGALFAAIEARLAAGRAPDMMAATEEALEALAAERGYALMGASMARGDERPPMTDPAYFDCLARSEARLMACAADEGARDAVGFLMRCLRDAFDLGRGRRMAGGEQALAADGPTGLQ